MSEIVSETRLVTISSGDLNVAIQLSTPTCCVDFQRRSRHNSLHRLLILVAITLPSVDGMFEFLPARRDVARTVYEFRVIKRL